MSNKQCHKQNDIGELPKDWDVKFVSEVCSKPQYGYTESASTEPIGPKFLRITDIRNGSVNWDKVPYCKCPRKLVSRYLLHSGDILFARTGSTGNSYLVKDCPEAVFASYLIRLRVNESMDPYYLFYFFNSDNYWKQIKQKRVGSIQTGINASLLSSLKLPVPPLLEQQKIAFILSTLDEAIQKTDEVIEKAEMLKQGLMQRLLTRGIGHTKFKQTKLGAIPEGWEVVRLGDVCASGTGGTPSRQRPEYFQGEIPWVKSTEIDFGVISHTEESISSEALKESSAKLYPKGTLLVALYGQGVTRGKCALLGIDAAINQACGAFQSKGKVQLHFAFFWLQANYRKIRALSQGSNQANLNLGLVRSIKLPLPPLTEQRKITSILSAVDEKIGIEKRRKEQLEKLKKGLMQDLLTGKVRVKVD